MNDRYKSDEDKYIINGDHFIFDCFFNESIKKFIHLIVNYKQLTLG